MGNYLSERALKSRKKPALVQVYPPLAGAIVNVSNTQSVSYSQRELFTDLHVISIEVLEELRVIVEVVCFD